MKLLFVVSLVGLKSENVFQRWRQEAAAMRALLIIALVSQHWIARFQGMISESCVVGTK